MMITKFRSLAALLAILAMVAGYTYAATHNNEPSPSDEMREKGQNGKGHHNHVSGKNLDLPSFLILSPTKFFPET